MASGTTLPRATLKEQAVSSTGRRHRRRKSPRRHNRPSRPNRLHRASRARMVCVRWGGRCVQFGTNKRP